MVRQISVAGEDVRLLPERCLYWEREGLLVVADLHLGRAEVFRQNGLWLPPAAHARDLALLTEVVQREGAKHVLFLGDFVHSAFHLAPETISLFASWRSAFSGSVTILLGNHDRGLEQRWPNAWPNVALAAEWKQGPFSFRHEPPSRPEPSFIWAGHVHPVVVLRGGADRLRLPCFFVTSHYGLLPAFTELAGGHELRPGAMDRAFVVAGRQVLELGPGAAKKKGPALKRARRIGS